MDFPITPTKRLLTEEDRQAFLASRRYYNSYVSDDLTAMLQNIGSRVRKNVTEGYATHRAGSVPPTPFSSPEKPRASAGSPNDRQIFRSMSDTLYEVLSSPTRVLSSPSPSPKKRGRAELEEETTESELDADGDAGMESDDESVTFVLTPSPTRPTRPLRKLSTPHLNSLSHTIIRQEVVDRSVSADRTVMQIDNAAPDKPQWTDMFNQEF